MPPRRYSGPLLPGTRSVRTIRRARPRTRSTYSTKSTYKNKTVKKNAIAIKDIRKNQNIPVYYKTMTDFPLAGMPWTIIPLLGGPSSNPTGSMASHVFRAASADGNGVDGGNLLWHQVFGDVDPTHESTLRVHSLNLHMQIHPSSENENTNFTVYIVSLKKKYVDALDRPYSTASLSGMQGTQATATLSSGGTVLTAMNCDVHYAGDAIPNASGGGAGSAFCQLNPKYFKIHKQWRLNTQGSTVTAVSGGPATEEQNQLLRNGDFGFHRLRHTLKLGNTTFRNSMGTYLDVPPDSVPLTTRKYLIIFQDGYNVDLEQPKLDLFVKYNCSTQR